MRHWDAWVTEYKEHLFVAHVNKDGLLTQAQDIMPNWQSDFAGIGQVSIHPNASSLVFSAKDSSSKDAAKDHAWTTNYDIFEVALSKGQSAFNLKNITEKK